MQHDDNDFTGICKLTNCASNNLTHTLNNANRNCLASHILKQIMQ